MQFTEASVDAFAQGQADLIDAGPGPGVLELYDGVPALPADPATGTLLCAIVLPTPCGTVAGGILTFGPISNGTGLATGSPTWGRIVDSTGLFVMQGRAGTNPQNCDFILDDPTVYAAQPVVVVTARFSWSLWLDQI